MGSGEQCSGPGPTEPHAICVGSENSGTGRGPGSSFAGGERQEQKQQQASTTTKTSVLESILFPGRQQLLPALF